MKPFVKDINRSVLSVDETRDYRSEVYHPVEDRLCQGITTAQVNEEGSKIMAREGRKLVKDDIVLG